MHSHTLWWIHSTVRDEELFLSLVILGLFCGCCVELLHQQVVPCVWSCFTSKWFLVCGAASPASGSLCVAVKILEKRHIIREKKVQYVSREKEVMLMLEHPFFIQLYFTFQDKDNLCIPSTQPLRFCSC